MLVLSNIQVSIKHPLTYTGYSPHFRDTLLYAFATWSIEALQMAYSSSTIDLSGHSVDMCSGVIGCSTSYLHTINVQ